MTPTMIIVCVVLALMIAALVLDKMRPGMIMLTAAIIYMACGIITPGEMLAGFSNKGMITVALLFLVSEGVRQSGAIGILMKKMLPAERQGVAWCQARMFPLVSLMSAFVNNTPVVAILAPVVKHWAVRMRMPVTYFLIPLSYATILGGMCTLIGTSTNLMVDGMMQSAGYRGFGMFELGKVGFFIAIAGIAYMLVFSRMLLPGKRQAAQSAATDAAASTYHEVEAVLGPRFPGINKHVADFDFNRHYGATIREVRRNGMAITRNLSRVKFREGDTLVLLADSNFLKMWGDSSVFMLLANGQDCEPPRSAAKRSLAMVLLVVMIVGATLGELPFVERMGWSVRPDMFFFASLTVVVMAWTRMFPARKYTKYISWDILVTIACAFAVSAAIVNSGLAQHVAGWLAQMGRSYGPHVLLAVLFVVTNLFTEVMTNNAAAALVFPLSVSLAEQMDVSPFPFFVTICVAASASFSTPIGYQTNLIVQGIGNYRFTDFLRFGLPLNILTFIISVALIPMIWPF